MFSSLRDNKKPLANLEGVFCKDQIETIFPNRGLCV